METGYIIEMLPNGESIWKNVVDTLDGKPVVFDTKEDADKVFNGFRSHFAMMPPGQIRVQAVEKSH